MGGQQSTPAQVSASVRSPQAGGAAPPAAYSDDMFNECLNVYLQLQKFLELAVAHVQRGGTSAARLPATPPQTPELDVTRRDYWTAGVLPPAKTLLADLQQLSDEATRYLEFLKQWRMAPEELRQAAGDLGRACSPETVLRLATQVVRAYPDPPADLVYAAFVYHPLNDSMREFSQMQPAGEAPTPYTSVSYLLGGLMYPQYYYGTPLAVVYRQLVRQFARRFPGLNEAVLEPQASLMQNPAPFAYAFAPRLVGSQVASAQ